MTNRRIALLLGWSFPLLLLGCALSENPGSPFAPADEQPRTIPDPRTPSSLQAMQQGVASVTPPGSPLKDVFFEFDNYDLSTGARDVLKDNAEWLRNNGAERIEIEGHCDDLGTSEYNLALGLKRAQGAKEYLVNLGIPAERLFVISYGKEAPACLESTEPCREKNRRARFVIVKVLPTS